MNTIGLDFESMMAAMPVATVAVDHGLKVTYVNEAAARLLGCDPAESTGSRLKDVLGGMVGKKGDLLTESLKAHRPSDIADYTVSNEEGEDLNVSISSTPMKKDGKTVGSVIFIKEPVTEKGVPSRVRLLENILDAIPYPLSVTDENMNWTFINKSVETMLGVKRTEVVGKQCNQWGANICKTEDCGIARLKHGQLQTRFQQQGASFKVDTAYILDDLGQKIGHIEIVQDITASAKKGEYTDAEVARLAGNLVKLAQGDLDLDLKVGQGPEGAQRIQGIFEKITENLSQVSGTINNMIDKMEDMHEEQRKGDMDAYIVADAFNGAYRRMVMQVNDSVAMHVQNIRRFLNTLDKYSQGDLAEKIERLPGKQAAISEAMDTMQRNVMLMVTDAEMLLDAAAGGKFDVRADVTHHKGSYAEIIDGVNQTLNKVTDRNYWYEQILDSIPFAISVTDMDMKLTFLNRASENVVKKNRAQMMGLHCSNWNGKICKTEECGITRLRAGHGTTYAERDGKITQVNTAYLKNDKGESVGHVEVLSDMSAAMKPAQYNRIEVERLSKNLINLAQGSMVIDSNLTKADQHTKEAHDNFTKVYASVDELKKAIEALASDAKALSNAAVDGKLATRADASKHQGEFRNIVQGVNDTLDAVIGPLNVA
ncbi:MAG: PAS domain-containing protein, partial [Methanomassiliicoccales archaeon]